MNKARKDFFILLKPLTNEQKVVLLMALCSQPARETLDVTTKDLFTATLTEEQAYYSQIEQIVAKLGMDTISEMCELLHEDIFFDDQKIRKTLNIAPFTDTKHPEIIECAIIEEQSQ